LSQKTIPQLFEESVKKFPQNTLMWEKTGDKYEATTYSEMKKAVQNFAGGY
jgi:long-subunit acyl-CoA synthetase (AMP-forming)